MATNTETKSFRQTPNTYGATTYTDVENLRVHWQRDVAEMSTYDHVLAKVDRAAEAIAFVTDGNEQLIARDIIDMDLRVYNRPDGEIWVESSFG